MVILTIYFLQCMHSYSNYYSFYNTLIHEISFQKLNITSGTQDVFDTLSIPVEEFDVTKLRNVLPELVFDGLNIKIPSESVIFALL